MAAPKPKKPRGISKKKAAALRKANEEFLARDEFAKSRISTLSRRKGEFKTAPEDIGGEVSRVGAQLTAQFDAFFVLLAGMSQDLEGQFSVLAGETFAAVQNRTPVDTGNARSGWKIERLEPAPGDIVYHITNSVGYSVYLEFGSSKQAPAGMLRVSLLELEDRLRRAMEAYSNAA